MTSGIQRDHLESWHATAEAIEKHARELVAPLTPAQLAWNPPDGGWSVGQVLEHLVVTSDLYMSAVGPRISHENAPRRTGSAARWRPTMLGGMLARSLRSGPSRKFPAPRKFRPHAAARPNVLDAFLRSNREVADAMHRAADLDLQLIRTASPVSPLIRLNLGDVFDTLLAHSQRHLGQIERVKDHPEFPRQ